MKPKKQRQAEALQRMLNPTGNVSKRKKRGAPRTEEQRQKEIETLRERTA